ncbi:uncharacterized protein LOC122037829 isoform X2 [Zingiber officinale]|uniref:uncharacterized protein LOC122037829 isoform X2 n=1 Tax=Zingiber officinale TaxID=94328 RepID=UPI001C4DA2AC|nr:uncharacterized protein LOC122037829 isoform X2 [Zingiber officinale]
MYSSQPTRFPVTHKSVSLDIKGNKTDIVICKYDDKFLVIVTQIGCMGTILHARKEGSVSTEPTFSVSVIFGKRDEPWLLACGRQLIEHISLPWSRTHYSKIYTGIVFNNFALALLGLWCYLSG